MPPTMLALADEAIGQPATSPLGQKAEIPISPAPHPLYLKADIEASASNVSQGPNPEVVALFDHLIGARQHHGRDDEVERLSNF